MVGKRHVRIYFLLARVSIVSGREVEAESSGAINVSYKGSVNKPHEKCRSGDWSINNMKAYLKVNGLNEEDIRAIC